MLVAEKTIQRKPNQLELRRQIRKAKPEDAGCLKKCMVSAYAPYQSRMGGARLPPMDVDYSAEIRNYPTWVFESDGCILGGLVMMFENDWASIANIAVDPNHQGQGIGGELMRFAEREARERKYSEIRLTTHALLEGNIRLYRHLGWEELNRDENRVFMSKKI